MGYQHVSITLQAELSRHNSTRDERDDAAWDELRKEILELIARKQKHLLISFEDGEE